MQRRSQKLEIFLDIQAVSCPGVWLSSRGSIYLSVCLLGHHIQTRDAAPVFPLMFHENFIVEKVFGHVFHLSELDDILEQELVYIELVQRTPLRPDSVLATFETSVRELLFPNITTTPQYSGADLDLLMEPSRHFPGALCPRLEVSTKTTVKEVRTAYGKSPKRRTLDADDTKARQQQEDVRPSAADARAPPDASTATAAAEDSGDEERRGRSRSRSRSRPPFIWRRADASLLGRQPGAPAARAAPRRSRSLGALTPPGRGRHCHCACAQRRRSASAERAPRATATERVRARARARSLERPAPTTRYMDADADYRDLNRAAVDAAYLPSDWCYGCSAYTTHHHCAVCDAYRRYFGRDYPGHHHHHRDCSCCYRPAVGGVRTVCAGRCAPDSDSCSEDSCSSRCWGRRAYYESMEQMYRRLALQAGRHARESLLS